MSSPEIRLECLKLAHRHDRSPAEVIDAAKEYLKWVGGHLPTTGSGQPGDSSKASKQLAPVKRTSPLKP